MIVRSTTNPDVSVLVNGKIYRFVHGICDMPDVEALLLTQGNTNYVIEGTVTDDGSTSEVARHTFNGATWTETRKKIIYDAPTGYANGYGKAAMALGKALVQRKDVELHYIQSHWAAQSNDYVPRELKDNTIKGGVPIDSYYIKFFPASEFSKPVAERFVGLTMLEASHIPASWVQLINNNCERVIVPCAQNKEAFINSGVTRDIAVVPLGLDFDLFPKVQQEEDENFIFGIMGTLTWRKGADIAVKAFKKAFPADKYKNVYLYIKTLPIQGITVNSYMEAGDLRDPRLILVTDMFSPEQLISEFFAKIDCFVFPTRGEGFGLPPLEAMGVGLPVICTNWSGPADFLDDKWAYPLGYKMVPVPFKRVWDENKKEMINGDWRGYGMELYDERQQWAEPNEDELVDIMRHVYENQAEARKKGAKAATHVRKYFSSKVAADKLVAYLDAKI